MLFGLASWGAAIAALSVSTPVSFLIMALGIGLAIAGSILIAQCFGAGNQTMVNHVAAQTLLIVISVGEYTEDSVGN